MIENHVAQERKDDMRNQKDMVTLIKNLSDAFGPSGFEGDVAEMGKREIGSGYETTIDALRNAYFKRKKNTGDRPKIWVDAHSDEVGYMVQAIRPNGTMDFLPLGGIDPGTMPATRVQIRNRFGETLPGIISSRPPHFMRKEDRDQAPKVENFVLDVGAGDAKDARETFGMRMALPFVPDVACRYDEKRDLFVGKAFDCRVGCAALLETLSRVAEADLGVDVVGTFTVQEEVGERGSMAAVDEIASDVCICFEGCPADDTFAPDYKIQSALRKGPMLRHMDVSMITHPGFQRFALEFAEKAGVPCQESVRRGGGTNGRYIHASRHGVPTIVIGIPVRYIHTSYGFCTLTDTLNAVRLAEGIIKALDEKTIQSF